MIPLANNQTRTDFPSIPFSGTDTLFGHSNSTNHCVDELEKAGKALLFFARSLRNGFANSSQNLPSELSSLCSGVVAILTSNDASLIEGDVLGGIDLAKRITGKSTSTIYHLVSKGEIPVTKAGGKLYFSQNALLNYVGQPRKHRQSSRAMFFSMCLILGAQISEIEVTQNSHS